MKDEEKAEFTVYVGAATRMLAGDGKPTIISANPNDTVAAFNAASLSQQADIDVIADRIVHEASRTAAELQKFAELPGSGEDAQKLSEAAQRLAKDVAIYATRIDQSRTPQLD